VLQAVGVDADADDHGTADTMITIVASSTTPGPGATASDNDVHASRWW
jgi:hypothetical protein